MSIGSSALGFLNSHIRPVWNTTLRRRASSSSASSLCRLRIRECVSTAGIVDFFVEGRVIVEVKSVEAIARIHYAQMITYLKLKRCRVGLLLNFNVASMRQGIRRVTNWSLEPDIAPSDSSALSRASERLRSCSVPAYKGPWQLVEERTHDAEADPEDAQPEDWTPISCRRAG